MHTPRSGEKKVDEAAEVLEDEVAIGNAANWRCAPPTAFWQKKHPKIRQKSLKIREKKWGKKMGKKTG